MEGFARWYTRLLRAVVRIDVKDSEFILFHRALQTVYRLAKTHSVGADPMTSDWLSRSTRSATSVFSDRLKRSIAIRQAVSRKRKADASSKVSPPEGETQP